MKKISEMISVLEKIKSNHGDIECYVFSQDQADLEPVGIVLLLDDEERVDSLSFCSEDMGETEF